MNTSSRIPLRRDRCGEGNEHLQVRDNINWKTIAMKLGTRNENSCMQKWYRILPTESNLVNKQGQDKILIEAVIRSGAESEVMFLGGILCLDAP